MGLAVGLAATAPAGIAIAAPADVDPIFAAIDTHRATYTAMERAEDDYNADPEEKEEGPLADRLMAAGEDEGEAFGDLLATEPRTLEGLLALICYVVEVGKRQEAKGHWDGGREMLFANLREVAAVRGVSVT
jgi:hypothetical protein